MHTSRLFISLLLLGTLPRVGISQSLSPEKEKIVASVNADQASSVSLLKQLVDINSGTLNPAGVHKVADVLRPKFESLGFACRWIPMEEVHRAGHLVCTREGNKGKRVLLIGHMDTVFEADSPFQHFEQTAGKTTGPGAADMKGGLVIMLSALKALNENHLLDGGKITVFLTGDEERPGEPLSIARRDLIEAGKASDAALEFEGGVQNGGHDAASIARRSAYQWVLTTTGKTAHSSGIFNKGVGDGAIYELSRILYHFDQDLREPGLTYNVGLVVGGTQASYDIATATGTAAGKVNVVPAKAQAVGDLRTVTDVQYKGVQEKMRQIISQHLPGTSAEIEFKDGYPSMPETDGNKELLKELNNVNRELGMDVMEPLDPSRRGAGDLSFVAPYVASISGLGSYGGGAHAPGETINLKRQPEQTRRVALYLYDLTRP
ncbi:MAG TPA: M20/M25/M40 family metallo-hydrolase [Bryobacteraceae bacterium]|nr:M20/M25/M40 family metallo-hydrolase [Bryobacteraceae bacterium]